jgi:hypothetical protein
MGLTKWNSTTLNISSNLKGKLSPRYFGHESAGRIRPSSSWLSKARC